MELRQVARRQRRQRSAHRGGDGVEDAEQRIRMTLRVADDEFGVVEVVAGVHPHALRQAAAHGDLLLLVEQADLHAVHLGGAAGDDCERGFHGGVVVVVAPVAFQRGVEHLPQPMDNNGLLHATEDAGVDPLIIVGRTRRLGQGARRHQDDAAAQLLDGLALFLVGADHVVHAHIRAGDQVVGAGAAGHDSAGVVLHGVQAAAHQFLRARPVQPHATLRCVHRFRDAQAE